MAAGPISERNQDATIYVGGLDDKVTEAIVWELFVQAGPVVNVHMPKDRVTQNHQGYGFVEFLGELIILEHALSVHSPARSFVVDESVFTGFLPQGRRMPTTA